MHSAGADPTMPIGAGSAFHLLTQQSIKACAHRTVETCRNACLNPAFGRNERISAVPFDNRQPGQNSLSPAAFFREATYHAFTGLSGLGMLIQPVPHLFGTLALEHPVPIGLAQ